MQELTLSRHWMRYQPSLFEDFEKVVAPITLRHQEIILALDVIRLEQFIDEGPRFILGRNPSSRLALARAFIAKAILNLPTTAALIDRLSVDIMLRRICGFESLRDVPSKGTFSNAFSEFSESDVLSKIHEKVIKSIFKDRIVGHVSRDATDIRGRERMPKKEGGNKKDKKRIRKKEPTGYQVGRPKMGETRIKNPTTRIERQVTQDLETMLTDLPMNFACGAKRGSTGHLLQWFGYKLHLDVDDLGIPLSCIVSSASLNDSQVAIPLEHMTSSRVTSLYSLMDKGYDSELIRGFIRSMNKVPLIQPKVNSKAPPFDPAETHRFKIRTTVERAYSDIKDNLGGRQVRVRSASKVKTHLMFGVLALVAFKTLEHLL